MNILTYVVWNPSLTIGPFRWYSLCWLVGLALAYLVVKRLYREQNIKDELFDPLFIYCFIGILVGARLGHCIFYQPDYFLTSGKGFVEMLLPIHFLADGGWRFTGYEGLASHGGTAGLMLALWLYCRKTRLSLWTVLDNIAIATGVTACFIRIGNLMNSEIIGKVTDVPWAFIFERVDQMPRHPGQLYEAIAYGILFALMWALHKRRPQKIGTGWFFGLCLTYIFTFRFFIEYTKEIQEAFEASLPLDMGQLLSIPFVIIGVMCMAGGKWMRRLTMTAALAVAMTTQGQAAEKSIYDLFAGDDAEAFYAASQKAKDRLLREGNRKDYYIYCINEVNYEIRHNHNFRALKMSEELLKEMREHEDGRYDMVYNAMASIYENHGNYRMARHYIDQALQYVEPHDTVGLVGAYLGLAYLEAPVHPDEALQYTDKVLPLCQRYPMQYSYALKIKGIANFFKDDSYAFYTVYDEYKVHKREHDINDGGSDQLMHTLREAFEGNYQQAADSINGDKFYHDNISRFDLLAKVYQLKGDQTMVIDLLRQKMNAIDSLNANHIFENLNEMSAEMEVAKTKEKAARQRVLWLLAVVMLLVALIALMLWRYLTRRRLQNELQRQNRRLEVALSRAEESDRMKNSFIEHVSHEIRTPLNIITGFTQVITNPDFDVEPKDRDRMLRDISRNTLEITNIVNELLEVAQDESRQHYEKADTIRVNEVCRKLVAKMEKYNDHHLKMDFVTDVTDDFTMVTNKEAFEKIITQLLDNALKFTEEGSVEVYTSYQPDLHALRVIITDTGVGIAKEHQEHIFDKFFKVDSFKQGFGLGLTVSHKMSHLLGGSLHLDKEYKDGARFILSLPAA